ETAGERVEHVVILPRAKDAGPMPPGPYLPWSDFLARAAGQSGAWVALEANEPAYILATSGTTAKPKLAVHVHGGYQVYIHSMGRWCFGMRPRDRKSVV